MMRRLPWFLAALGCAAAFGCGDDIPTAGATDGTGSTGTSAATGTSGADGGSEGDSTGGTPPELDVEGWAGQCVSLRADAGWLAASTAGDGFAFSAADADGAARFFLQASDLGTYLLYDADGGYLVAEDGPLLRQTSLQSDVLLVDDSYVSGAEWNLQPSTTDPSRYQLHNRRTDAFLGADGLTGEAQAAPVSLESATGCTPHPELTLDAEGTVRPPSFDDGALFGIVDTHSHILSNFGFGGGGIFHGGAFHRLGVEHALPDCEPFHGPAGRKDFFGFAYDTAGSGSADIGAFLPSLLAGELEEDNHVTAGYPDFTEWPSAPTRSTHQTQYWRWLERAWMAGLRLVVQHATTNSIICEMMVGADLQPARYSCDDMTAVDRIIDETRAMERYIDAQSGGAGLGWFRIVHTPAEAREVIGQGKLAVILGIETSNLFECRLTPYEDDPVCDEAYVIEQLDAYHERGVRAIFPVHKYDNAFSAGDGDRAFIEAGNFLNSGHWSNFTLDCPVESAAVFDHGDVSFGGLNMPRDDYDAPPPHDFSTFATNPIGTAFPHLGALQDPPLVGEYCQNAGLTPLGETLIAEMMARGMILEIDHLPQRSYERAFELLEAADYPLAATHGSTNDGRVYALGGISKTGLGRCRDPENPGAMLERLQERVALITDNGGYPAEGFGFDLNGFAGAPGPRFAPGACPDPQEDPITYPFTSWAGDVTFTEPSVGNRVIDFNEEGMVHIGLLPELIEDARGDAVSDSDLEPLFRSAEGYVRMWERAEERAAALRGG
jgi:hypothetical protein